MEISHLKWVDDWWWKFDTHIYVIEPSRSNEPIGKASKVATNKYSCKMCKWIGSDSIHTT